MGMTIMGKRRRNRQGRGPATNGKAPGHDDVVGASAVAEEAAIRNTLDGEILARDGGIEAAFVELVGSAPPLMRERLCNHRLHDPDEIRTYHLACLGLRSLVRDADDLQWILLREQALEDVEKERARGAKTLLVRHTRPAALKALLGLIDPSSPIDLPPAAILAGDTKRLERAEAALALGGLSLADVQDMAVQQCLADLQALDILQHGPDLRQRRSRELMMLRQADGFAPGGEPPQPRPVGSGQADMQPASPPAQARPERIPADAQEPSVGSSAGAEVPHAAPAAKGQHPAIVNPAPAGVVMGGADGPSTGGSMPSVSKAGHAGRSDAPAPPPPDQSEAPKATAGGSSHGR
jgi:hypothetical protein